MIIEQSVYINASPEKVWRVFIEPEITRQMGGEYVSDWKADSFIGWKGNNGALYTHGKILDIRTEELLKHQLFDGKEAKAVLSIITYTLENNEGNTVLKGVEELSKPLGENERRGVVSAWESALNAVKRIAENL
ncbi:SRPBCC domain-containing protein [Pedobacter foliorum]|uniref:SRPBCC domain-containing protein n=1 Tax=Pedobacter foliorum TaxID=2739058 RepID=UPI0015667E37|nr:SRPBCC domain-containing protein [Pedobacter foliorum]NRF37228.1 SRPBCC domain-containing protein [Pedobacter foliorum]